VKIFYKTEHLTKRFPDLRKLGLNWVLYFILTLLKLMQFLGWKFPAWTNWHAIQSHAGITTQFCWISQSFTNRYCPTNFSAGRILQWGCFLLSDRHSSVNKPFIGWKSSQAQIIIFFDRNNEVNIQNKYIHAKFVETETRILPLQRSNETVPYAFDLTTFPFSLWQSCCTKC